MSEKCPDVRIRDWFERDAFEGGADSGALSFDEFLQPAADEDQDFVSAIDEYLGLNPGEATCFHASDDVEVDDDDSAEEDDGPYEESHPDTPPEEEW